MRERKEENAEYSGCWFMGTGSNTVHLVPFFTKEDEAGRMALPMPVGVVALCGVKRGTDLSYARRTTSVVCRECRRRYRLPSRQASQA